MRFLRSGPGPRSRADRPTRWRRRVLFVAGCALLAGLASGCSGSSAPEPGEHEGKHDDTGAVLGIRSAAPGVSGGPVVVSGGGPRSFAVVG
jgi:hypothetical protein